MRGALVNHTLVILKLLLECVQGLQGEEVRSASGTGCAAERACAARCCAPDADDSVMFDVEVDAGGGVGD